jgi:hypothetical protein
MTCQIGSVVLKKRMCYDVLMRMCLKRNINTISSLNVFFLGKQIPNGDVR